MLPSPFSAPGGPTGPRWYRYLRFWRRDVQRDIDDELRFHFDARIDELVEQGVSADAARAQALAEFGDVHDVRGRLREIDDRVAKRRRRADVLDVLRQDLVYAARSLRRTPAMSLTIIVTLALGLGVNAAMFSLLDVIFLRPPAGVANPAEVRRIWSERKFTTGVKFWSGFDYHDYAVLSRALDSTADMAIYWIPRKRPLARGETPPTANVSSASASYFSVLGLRPLLGRFYTADEDAIGGPQPVAVVSERFWKRELRGDQSAIGQKITLGTDRLTVIGVAPHRFTGVELDAADVWVPLATGLSQGRRPWYQNSNVNGFQLFVRLRPGARAGVVEQRITAILRGPGVTYQDTAAIGRLGGIVKANGPGEIATEMRVAMRLGGVAVVVLLIACANVVNLLLARAMRRQREIAVRLALGISRGRLLRLLLTESVLLALIAAAAASLAGYWGGAVLRNLLMPKVQWGGSPMHWRVLFVALAGAIVAGLVAGLVPALQSRVPDLTNALKAGAREGGVHRSRLRSSLIVVQTALSVLLLVGAALFVKSLNNVRGRDIGFAVDRLAFVELRNEALDSVARAAQSDRLLALESRFANIRGVEAVAYTWHQPKEYMSFINYYPWTDTAGRKKPLGMYSSVTPEFFAATGTKLLRGRTFSRGSAGSSAPYTVVVNEEMARELWPNENPLGKCVRFEKATAPCATVIGVSQTAMQFNVTEKPSPHFYLSLQHAPVDIDGVGAVVLRLNPDRMPAALGEMHALLRAEFPQVYSRTVTMAQAMEPEYRPWRLGAIVFSLFGLLALIVAAIGIYSTVSYAVGQRTHEFGVRVALGATMRDVLGQVLGEGLRVVTLGVMIGVLLALAGGRLIGALLYGIAPSDPAAMLGAAGVLLAVAAMASLVPAWRAAKADPVTALRAE